MNQPKIVYLGIDPGASGALAAVGEDGSAVTFPLASYTPTQLWELFARFRPSPVLRPYAAVERVSGYTKAGGPQPGSAMFTFGFGAGRLDGFLLAAGIPHRYTTPQAWQKRLQIPSRGKTEPKGKFKNRLADTARRMFPGLKVTLATGDALLIAEFCRRERSFPAEGRAG